MSPTDVLAASESRERDLFTAVLHKPASPDHIVAVVQRYAAPSA